MIKKEKLNVELKKIIDTGRSRIIKKYNLSLDNIYTVIDVLNKKYNTFLSKEVADCLKDYDYEIVDWGIGYKLVEKGNN